MVGAETLAWTIGETRIMPRKKLPSVSGAAEKSTGSKRCDARNAKEQAKLEDRDLATFDEFSDAICPFATSTEWASEADEAAYRDL